MDIGVEFRHSTQKLSAKWRTREHILYMRVAAFVNILIRLFVHKQVKEYYMPK